eukprot:1160540-Pelagomonas_calceolata.AAC.10
MHRHPSIITVFQFKFCEELFLARPSYRPPCFCSAALVGGYSNETLPYHNMHRHLITACTGRVKQHAQASYHSMQRQGQAHLHLLQYMAVEP